MLEPLALPRRVVDLAAQVVALKGAQGAAGRVAPVSAPRSQRQKPIGDSTDGTDWARMRDGLQERNGLVADCGEYTGRGRIAGKESI